MDKINGFNPFTGKVQNDLAKESSKKQPEKSDAEKVDTNAAVYSALDPDQVMNAMKKHGLYNMVNIKKNNDPALLSISQSMEHFTSQIPPENYNNLTKKVTEACSKEFPNQKLDSEFISQVVENIIFESL